MGQLGALVELMVYYCEQTSDFGEEFGVDDETYLGALVRMFEQALATSSMLPEIERRALWGRAAVSHNCRDFGSVPCLTTLLN